jgi:hypothetical protein
VRPPWCRSLCLDFCSYEPDALDDADKDFLITFAITFLSPNYVNNPFLKAKLVSVSMAMLSLYTTSPGLTDPC